MSNFCVCNPYILPTRPNVIEFILDYRESCGIGQGTKEFMQEILRDIGFESEVVMWVLQPFRSKYYSEFVGADDWRDNWILNWLVSVETLEPLGRLPLRSFPLIGTDAFDSTWGTAKILDDDAIVNCLVISDFESENQREEAQKFISETVTNGKLKKLREINSAGLPTYSYSEILGKYKQLQVNLGKFPRSFFAQGANYAQEVMELCKRMDGTVSFEDRL